MSPASTPRRGLRRLLTAALAAALIGAGAFGVQTLRAAPASICNDPIATCAIGGQPQCDFCCEQEGAVRGTCQFGPCICIQG